MPLAVNLLGTMERVVWSMSLEKQEELEDLGKKLALLQQPSPELFGYVIDELMRQKQVNNS